MGRHTKNVENPFIRQCAAEMSGSLRRAEELLEKVNEELHKSIGVSLIVMSNETSDMKQVRLSQFFVIIMQ